MLSCTIRRPGFKLIDATDAVIDAPYAFGKAESGSNAIAVLDLDEELSKQSAKEIADWFVEHGKAQPHEIQAIGVGCDVSSEEAVKKAMATVYEKFGRIDVLVRLACCPWSAKTTATDVYTHTGQLSWHRAQLPGFGVPGRQVQAAHGHQPQWQLLHC